MATTIHPTDEQQAVIDAPVNDDIVIIAGAGSGKTFTLMQRIEALIHHNVRPEHILGLTFTRKATAQLQEKVSYVMDQRAGSTERSINALMRPTVMTYDAFFNALVQRYGLLVGMSQDVTPLSDAGRTALMTQVASEHVETIQQYRTSDNNYAAMSSIVSQALALASEIASSMIDDHVTSIAQAVMLLRQWDHAMLRRLDALAHGATHTAQDADIEQSTSDAQSVRGVHEATSITLPECAGYFDDTDVKEAAEYLGVSATVTKGELEKILRAVRNREVLLDLVLAFDQRKRNSGLVEFSDITIAAIQLVVRFPSIGRTYRKLFTHVLLDEYQDTSTTQSEVLTRLFHAEAIDRSAITAVGDPFQSIYAWRGASPGAFTLFNHKLGRSAHNDRYGLTQTMRNSIMVLEAANMITQPLRSHTAITSAQLREVDVQQLQARTHAPTGTVGALHVTTHAQEVQAAAHFAQEAVRRYGEQARAQGEAAVCILARSKASMNDYRDAVEALGMSCEVVGLNGLLTRPDVADMLHLLRALADTSDPAPLMHLTASARFGFDAQALTALAKCAEELNARSQYDALVAAGVIQDDLDTAAHVHHSEDQRNHSSDQDREHNSQPTLRDIQQRLRPYRNQLPARLGIVDMLTQPQFASIFTDYLQSHNIQLDDAMMDSLIMLSRVLRSVERSMHRGIQEALYSVFRALQIDIDAAVAAALAHIRAHDADTLSYDTAASSSSHALETLLSLADSYIQELPDGVQPSIIGYLDWLDQQREVKSDTEEHTTGVDVVIMTIHQSKGLEWPAVIIPGLLQGSFPGGGGSDGDNLKVEYDTDVQHTRPYAMPQYTETASSWLVQAVKVPSPVRADSSILPRFPHNANNNDSVDKQLAGIDSLRALVAEAYIHKDKGKQGQKHPINDDNGTPWVSLSCDYGRRSHDDDRRLMYVAATRARYDLLVIAADYASDMTVLSETCSDEELLANSSALSRKKKNIPSNFWYEVYGALWNAAHDAEHTAAKSGVVEFDRAQYDEHSVEAVRDMHTWVDGIMVGDYASEYYHAAIEHPWQDPSELSSMLQRDTWPWHVEPPQTSAALLDSAQRVQAQLAVYRHNAERHTALHQSAQQIQSTQQSQSVQQAQSARAGRSAEPKQSAAQHTAVRQPNTAETLTDWAQHLIDSDALVQRTHRNLTMHDLSQDMDTNSESVSTDQHESQSAYTEDIQENLAQLRAYGLRIQEQSRQSMTSVQYRLTQLPTMSEQEELAYWRGIVRPMPAISSFTAEAGTDFHAWAQEFIVPSSLTMQYLDNVQTADDISHSMSDASGAASVATGLDSTSLLQIREAMIDELEQQFQEAKSIEDTHLRSVRLRELAWRSRLANSPWAHRIPVWVEHKVIVDYAGKLMSGTIDAVFVGGLYSNDELSKYDRHGETTATQLKLYTIIDWKTGRRPTGHAIGDKLVQLDLYRVALARSEGISVDQIDAALYYVSESDPQQRLIPAEPLTEQEILARLQVYTV